MAKIQKLDPANRGRGLLSRAIKLRGIAAELERQAAALRLEADLIEGPSKPAKAVTRKGGRKSARKPQTRPSKAKKAAKSKATKRTNSRGR